MDPRWSAVDPNLGNPEETPMRKLLSTQDTVDSLFTHSVNGHSQLKKVNMCKTAQFAVALLFKFVSKIFKCTFHVVTYILRSKQAAVVAKPNVA